MKTSHQIDRGEIQRSKNSIQEPVWVQCVGYRCLAVLDHEGNWRNYHNRKPIHDLVTVLEHGALKSLAPSRLAH